MTTEPGIVPPWDQVDPAAVLALPISDGPHEMNFTIKFYLYELLKVLWAQQEGFSGKRPFGDSGWEYDLYLPLIRAGLIAGSLDEYGYIEDVDSESADKIIDGAIYYAFHGERRPPNRRRARPSQLED